MQIFVNQDSGLNPIKYILPPLYNLLDLQKDKMRIMIHSHGGGGGGGREEDQGSDRTIQYKKFGWGGVGWVGWLGGLGGWVGAWVVGGGWVGGGGRVGE